MPHSAPSHSVILRRSFMAVAMMVAAGSATADTDAPEMIEIALPVAAGARAPSLAVPQNGRLAMSWLEPEGHEFTVKVAIRDAEGWSAPATVTRSDEIFVNWADFPSIAAFPDGTLAVHWLEETANSAYAYDVNIELSQDDGHSWGTRVVPHSDRSPVQHGFVSLQPLADDRMLAVWLDGRAEYKGLSAGIRDTGDVAMQLRMTTLTSDGGSTGDTLLDARTCSCCQTASTMAGDGSSIVAYRDRTDQEIRDISVIRRIKGDWTTPNTVHDDGWEISGCPVNGPAIDAHGQNVAVAWFTAADDVPAAKIAFSVDAGASFAAPFRVDQGETAGRVDVLQMPDGSAVMTWVEWQDAGEALMLCRIWPDSGCTAPQQITLNTAPGSINFARMAFGADGVYVVWTQPLHPPDAGPERDSTLRMVRLAL